MFGGMGKGMRAANETITLSENNFNFPAKGDERK